MNRTFTLCLPGFAFVIALAAVLLMGTAARATDCGDAWLPQVPGPTNSVFALTSADIGEGNVLYAGGSFTKAGAIPASRIAYWDGQGWHNMGSGVSDPVIAEVYAIRKYKNTIVAGGLFSNAGGVTANRIAQWNGANWSPLGAGVTGAVWAIEEYEDDLIAGGFFKSAGGSAANRIARWDGQSWHTMGPTGSVGMNGPVVALATYKGDLIAGGDFTTAGGAPANFIARWDGQQWHPLGEGLDDAVRALLVVEDTLIVGGRFANAGGTPASMIAAWDGEQWHAMGEGLAGGFIAPGVEALAVFSGNIIAGGSFTISGDGDPSFSRIARWSGPPGVPGTGAWHPLDEGLNSTVWALGVFGEELQLGGYFTTVVGGRSMPYWGRWNITGLPQISEHPSDTSAPIGGIASFTVTATGVDRAFQWRRDGLPLEDNERISGSATDALTIDPVIEADAGTYDVLIVSPCGTIGSDSAQLAVGAIPGDLTGSGTVGVADLLILLGMWGACPECGDCIADLTGDCNVGVPDLLILLGNWG